jgi:hypothetical protein
VRALTPPDPNLKGAWYPGGFNRCTCRVENRFQGFAFLKRNSHRYAEGGGAHREAAEGGGCTGCESSRDPHSLKVPPGFVHQPLIEPTK